MELAVGVKAFIQNNKGEYLFLKRAKPYPGDTKCKWDVPGGRIHAGEELLHALAREIKEETTMELRGEPTIIAAQDILKDKHTVRITYLAEAEGDVCLDPKEHQDYQWVSLEKAKDMYKDIYLNPVVEKLINQKVVF